MEKSKPLRIFVVVQSLSGAQLLGNPWTAALHTPHPSLSPRVCSNSCLLSQRCCLTISSSATLLSVCLQSFPESRFLLVSRLFTSSSQSIGTLASVLPVNIQGWLPLGLIGLISLLPKRLSRVFSSTTIWKHQFSGAQPLEPSCIYTSLDSNQRHLNHVFYELLRTHNNLLNIYFTWL